MYLMYVDESGDTGLSGSPTRYFALSGLVVHEHNWRDFINDLVQFRRDLKAKYGLPVRTEIHASEFINSQVHGLARHVSLAILRETLDHLASIPYISITNVIVDKSTKPAQLDVFDFGWKVLFQRFENTLQYGNFYGNYPQDKGFVITDATAGHKLARLVRKMAVHNYVPSQQQYGSGSRNLSITRIVEDPYGKDSKDTLPIQMVDVSAYFLYQKFTPNSYLRRKRAHNYFGRLKPALNLRASSGHPEGIVVI